jgi:hypothetical protein
MLEKIKVVDELLFQLKQSTDMLRLRESEVRDMKVTVTEREEEYEKVRRELEEIIHSRFWSLARKYYQWRDGFLPPGSGLRRLYDKVLDFLKEKRIVK